MNLGAKPTEKRIRAKRRGDNAFPSFALASRRLEKGQSHP